MRGKYRILAKVGQGGMGSVYKAVHTRFKEVRAIKVISPELASDPNFVRRFEQEAIITRKLQHPNAVRVEDIEEAEDGRPFIVMEYIEGRSLKEVIEQEAPMATPRVTSIIGQVAAALSAAHGLGLVHRDVKPANVALVKPAGLPDSSELVKVLDFGIAKLKETHFQDSKAYQLEQTLTETGVVIGTPAYMSPEQAKGLKGDQLDGRSDLYSLGIVMYQMLTGELPFKADSTLELLMAHINTPPTPIQAAYPHLRIPNPVANVVMKCLEKTRERRPASGQALLDELKFAEDVAFYVPSKALSTDPRNRLSRAMEGGQVQSPLRMFVWIAASLLIAGALGSAWFLRTGHSKVVDGNRVAAPVVSGTVQGGVREVQNLTSTTKRPVVDSTSHVPQTSLSAELQMVHPVVRQPLANNKSNIPGKSSAGPLPANPEITEVPIAIVKRPLLEGMPTWAGDLGSPVIVAFDAQDLAVLNQKADRRYYEFTLSKGGKPQRIASVELDLKEVNVMQHTFTLNITSDDKTIEKKDRNITEPIQFYSGPNHQLYDIVVWQLYRSKLTGYLSIPLNAASLVGEHSNVASPNSSAAAPLSSSLVIWIQPAMFEAEVWIDGKTRGFTDTRGYFRVAGLTSGSHHTKLSHSGYLDYEDEVELHAGPNTKLVYLTAVTASKQMSDSAQKNAGEEIPIRASHEFDVVHPHGKGKFGIAKFGIGKLTINDGEIVYAESDERDHDFKISCAQIQEAKPAIYEKVGFAGDEGVFLIAFLNQKYFFTPTTAPNLRHQVQQEILRAMGIACPGTVGK